MIACYRLDACSGIVASASLSQRGQLVQVFVTRREIIRSYLL